MSRKERCEKFIALHRNILTAHVAAYFFCIKDKDPTEIAEIMDLPESQVRAMIQRWLKNAMNAEYGLSSEITKSTYIPDQLWKNTYQRCKRDVTSEIVHCKDCAYFSEHKDYYLCGVNVLAYVRRDDYCSRAERRTDDVSL